MAEIKLRTNSNPHIDLSDSSSNTSINISSDSNSPHIAMNDMPLSPFADISNIPHTKYIGTRDVWVDGVSVVDENNIAKITGKANVSDLAAVSFSGDYDDLIGKPQKGMDIPYGYCENSASTVNKTVEIDGVTSLETGMMVAVKFKYINVANDPTLNVNSLGAKRIQIYGTTSPSSIQDAWRAQSVVIMAYDGEYWQICNSYDSNTKYDGMAPSEAKTGTSYALKLINAYVLKTAIAYHVLDIFYPVGSYYETSDADFDPNESWGGTWELEAEGQVHVSAGDNYAVEGALTNTTDGGEATHKLETTEIPAHTHGNKSITGTLRPLYWSTQQGKTEGICTIASGNKDRTAGSGTNFGTAATTINASHEHSSVGGSGAHNNMQPYIIVKRWHRTA